MKVFAVLSFALFAISAQAKEVDSFPEGACTIESQEVYVQTGGVDVVFVCQSGVWTYFYTRSAKN